MKKEDFKFNKFDKPYEDCVQVDFKVWLENKEK